MEVVEVVEILWHFIVVLKVKKLTQMLDLSVYNETGLETTIKKV